LVFVVALELFAVEGSLAFVSVDPEFASLLFEFPAEDPHASFAFVLELVSLKWLAVVVVALAAFLFVLEAARWVSRLRGIVRKT
jgi:hypothetical protein